MPTMWPDEDKPNHSYGLFRTSRDRALLVFGTPYAAALAGLISSNKYYFKLGVAAAFIGGCAAAVLGLAALCYWVARGEGGSADPNAPQDPYDGW